MMQKNRQWKVLAWVGVSVMSIGLIANSIAKVEKGETRPLTTETWMERVVKPSSKDLKKRIAAGPKTDDDWQALIEHAEILNETSYILMEDKRCPDKVWADSASKTLRNGSAALITAAKAKDAKATEAAFKGMMKSCKECHTKHKKEHH
ncbi:MAG: hypothetical protein L3J39_03130 [Verrucomicrobiales bacterium]|nr:hypothetical protein [Verrucomicrobiales bacterium]